LQKSEAVLDNLGSQKRERAWRGALGIRTRGEEDGEGAARANASCESGQALEKAQNGNARLLEKVGKGLGRAPRRLGFGATRAGMGATSAWIAPRRVREAPRSVLGKAPAASGQFSRAVSSKASVTGITDGPMIFCSPALKVRGELHARDQGRPHQFAIVDLGKAYDGNTALAVRALVQMVSRSSVSSMRIKACTKIRRGPEYENRNNELKTTGSQFIVTSSKTIAISGSNRAKANEAGRCAGSAPILTRSSLKQQGSSPSKVPYVAAESARRDERSAKGDERKQGLARIVGTFR
jgi:hypothetical protein